jgi:transposase
MDGALSPSPSELRLEELRITPGPVAITATAKRRFGRCRSSGEPTQQVHSRSTRRIADLPWHGIPSQVQLRCRRFFCDTPGCLYRIFMERLPATVTCRLSAAHRQIAHALGGEAGARLAEALGLGMSADTMLRRRKHASVEAGEIPAPRRLGADE